MVITREYVIVLPFTVEEYELAQKWYDLHRAPGELLKSEPFLHRPTGETGHYEKRLCSNDSRTPTFVRSVAPAGSLDMYQETWDSAGCRKSVLTNGYLKDRFNITVRTMQLSDTGTTENPHNLPCKKLKDVERVNLNIASAESCGCNNQENNPSEFISVKTGRGKLSPTWVVDALKNRTASSPSDGKTYGETPLMCCYVLVDVEVKIFGLQSKLEKTIQLQTKNVLIENYQKMFCSIDNWYGLTTSDIENTQTV